MLSDLKQWTCWLVIIVFAAYTTGQDPCLDTNNQEIDSIAKRSPSYDMDSAPLCDRYITETWYRAKSHVLSTLPPTLGKCGTLYPVWLKDPFPPAGETQSLIACEVGFSDNCGRHYEIDIKNCTSFLVYKLKPLDVCNSAYCFELDDRCVNESVQSVRVSVHNITWTKKTNGVLKQYDPSVNLICSFTPSDDDTLLYHIDWYVDNETVIKGQTVDKSSLDDAILSAVDLNKAGKKINSWIHCVVGVKKSINHPSCFSQSSKLFFAGVEILNHTLTIERKGSSTLMMRPTIPFVSETIQFPDGKEFAAHLNIELSFPGNSEAKCKQSSSGNLKTCSVTIDSFTYSDSQKYKDETNWYKIHTIEVSNSDDNEDYYMQDHKLALRLITNNANGQGAQIFSNVVFKDVHINVVDNKETWKGKRCSSYADPHQTTFDGYNYECQATGCFTGKTYIFYRNEDHLQELQVRHDNCWGAPRCVCAVAARSGQDVFTIDACNQRQFINFPLCNENALKVIKETDKVYKIIFPTGSFVKVLLYNYGSSSWYINLEVYPTVSDVGRTSGLCGVLDNDKTNDLRRRDGTQDNIYSFSYNNPPDGFSLSWQLSEGSSEDLLSNSQAVFESLTPLSSSFYKLCTCDNAQTVCSYKQYTECKTNSKGKEFHCVLHSSSRKKRDLGFLSRFYEPKAISEKLEAFKKGAFNKNDASDICNEAFYQSAYYSMCLELVPNFSNETLVNCISDLTITGDHNLTQLHLDTALGQCQAYITLNSTLEKEQPEVSLIVINLCPNNCSNRGICSEGNCTCDYGFGGSDCSFDVLSPPTIRRLSGDGICDKSSESCVDITLYGQYFLENMGTTCYVTRKEVNQNGSVISTSMYNVLLIERTLYEGYCSLEYSTEPSWMTTFQFNLSNNRIYYSERHTVYIYQSVCQTLHNVSGYIYSSLQIGYCYIDGHCVQARVFKNNDSCLQCLPSSNSFDWTFDCNEPETSNIPLSPSSFITSTIVISSTKSSTKVTTETTTKTFEKEQNTNRSSDNDDDGITMGLIGIAVTVGIVVAITFATTGYMLKQKWCRK